MTKVKKVFIGIGITTGIVLVVDLILLLTGWPTITEVVREYSFVKNYTIIPYFIGLLVGHFFIVNLQIAKINNLEFKKNSIQNIRIILKPHSSPYPIKPKKMLNVILAALIGIFLMVFVSFIIEYISQKK